MIKLSELEYNGKTALGCQIESPGGEGHPNMLIINCKRGYIMCGYLNTEAAEKFHDAAAVISGANFDEMLDNPVKAVTSEGTKLSITIGMKGREVFEILNQPKEAHA